MIKDIELGIDGYEKGSFFSFYGELLKFLSFRYFFIHSYSFILDKEVLNILIDSINDVWMDFRNKINDYLK